MGTPFEKTSVISENLLAQRVFHLYERLPTEQQPEVLKVLQNAQKDYSQLWRELRAALVFNNIIKKQEMKSISWDTLYSLKNIFAKQGESILPNIEIENIYDLYHKHDFSSNASFSSLFRSDDYSTFSSGEKNSQLLSLIELLQNKGTIQYPKRFQPSQYGININIQTSDSGYIFIIEQEGYNVLLGSASKAVYQTSISITQEEVLDLINIDFSETKIVKKLQQQDKIIFSEFEKDNVDPFSNPYRNISILRNTNNTRSKILQFLTAGMITTSFPISVLASPKKQKEDTISAIEKNESPSFSPGFINLSTASGITGIYVQSLRKGEFTPKTMATFAVAQLARRTLLQQSGNTEQVKADDEILKSAAFPVLLTTILTDLFDQSLKINQNQLTKILEKRIQEVSKNNPQENFSFESLLSMENEANTIEYFTNLEKQSAEKIAIQAGYILGISSGLGGLIMGVPTSQITNALKIGILQPSIERIFAKKVLENPQQYINSSKEEKRTLYDAARNEGNKEFNAPFGFSMLTVVQGSWGMWGLHNSPSPWFMAKHPAHIAGQQARGFALTGVLNTSCTLAWCKKMEFSTEEIALVMKGTKDIFSKISVDAKNITLGGSPADIAKILSKKGASEEIIEKIKQLEPSLFSISLQEYFDKKSIAIDQWKEKIPENFITKLFIPTEEEKETQTEKKNNFEKIKDLFLSRSYKDLRKVMQEKFIPQIEESFDTNNQDIFSFFNDIIFKEGGSGNGSENNKTQTQEIQSVLDTFKNIQIDLSDKEKDLINSSKKLQPVEKKSLLLLFHSLQRKALQSEKQSFFSEDTIETGSTITSQSLAVPALVVVLETLIINPLLKIMEKSGGVSGQKKFLIAKGIADFFSGVQAGFADDQSGANMDSSASIRFLKKYFGDDILEKNPDFLPKMDEIIALFMHVQGLLSRVGNPATMQQDKLEMQEDGTISQRKLTGEELRPIFPVNNGYAAAVNAMAYPIMFGANKILINSLKK